MLSVIRNSISFHRARKQSQPFPDGVLSGHVLRDLGFESRQAGEIMPHVAGNFPVGRQSQGMDAELSCCARTPANSNERDDDAEPALPDWWFSRMQATVAMEILRLKRCPTG